MGREPPFGIPDIAEDLDRLMQLTGQRRIHPPRIIRTRSKLHGFGVFALEPINKNTRAWSRDATGGEQSIPCRPGCPNTL